jgi:putative ABC transport system ATP-binding protein
MNSSPSQSEPIGEGAIAFFSVVANGVTHVYKSGAWRSEILKDINFNVKQGEFVSLAGPSGCGKTTLMTLVGGLKPLQTGSLKVLGCELNGCSERTLLTVRSKIGVIFQHHHLMEFLTAAQNVQIAMESSPTLPLRDRVRRSRDFLRLVGLEGKENSYPSKLSGGQKHRVACARAIACDPLLILADEPTASLDRHTGKDLILALKSIAHERGISMLMATHDSRVMDLADRLIQIDDGRIVS